MPGTQSQPGAQAPGAATRPLRIGVIGVGRIGRMHAELLARQVPGAELAMVHDVTARGGRRRRSRARRRRRGQRRRAAALPRRRRRRDLLVDRHPRRPARRRGARRQGGRSARSRSRWTSPRSTARWPPSPRPGSRCRSGSTAASTPPISPWRRRWPTGRSATCTSCASPAATPRRRRWSTCAGPGGIFLDMTIHDFDMARYVTGSEVVEVYACGALRVEPSFAEAGDVDTAVVTLTHANGCLTVIDNSRQAVYGYDQRVEAFGRHWAWRPPRTPWPTPGSCDRAGHERAGAAALLPRSLRAQLPARVGRVRRGGARRRDAAGHRRGRARAAGDRPGGLALAARAAPRCASTRSTEAGPRGRERPLRGPAPDGKVLVVTGSTQGLGAAIARRAVERRRRGHRRLRARAPARRGGARRARGARREAVFVAADLADEAQCRAIVRACEERFGRLDGLVNAAGLSSRGTLDDTSAELWDRLFAVNARAPFLLMQEAARLMRRAGGGGSIVNIITMASHGGEPVLTGYSASKAALATLTRNAGYQLAPDRIRVNGLNIGWTATEGEHAVQMGEGRPADWQVAADAGRPLGPPAAPRRHRPDGHLPAERRGADGHRLGHRLRPDGARALRRARRAGARGRRMTFDLITMGRVGVDLYPEQIGVHLADVRTFAKSLGGSATNVAVAAARLGVRAAVITKVGDDPFGPYVRDALRGFGVDAALGRHPSDAAHAGRLLRDLPARRLPAAVLPRADRAGHDARDRRARPRRDPRRARVLDDGHRAVGRAEPRGDAGGARGAATAADAITVHDLDHRPMFWSDDADAGALGARGAVARHGRGRQPRRGRGRGRHARPARGVGRAARARRAGGDRQAGPRRRARAHGRRRGRGTAGRRSRSSTASAPATPSAARWSTGCCRAGSPRARCAWPTPRAPTSPPSSRAPTTCRPSTSSRRSPRETHRRPGARPLPRRPARRARRRARARSSPAASASSATATSPGIGQALQAARRPAALPPGPQRAGDGPRRRRLRAPAQPPGHVRVHDLGRPGRDEHGHRRGAGDHQPPARAAAARATRSRPARRTRCCSSSRPRTTRPCRSTTACGRCRATSTASSAPSSSSPPRWRRCACSPTRPRPAP